LFHGSSQSSIGPVFFTCTYKYKKTVVVLVVVGELLLAVAVVVAVVVVTAFTCSFCGESASTYKMFFYVPIQLGQSRAQSWFSGSTPVLVTNFVMYFGIINFQVPFSVAFCL
jgi:hypothetical protein